MFTLHIGCDPTPLSPFFCRWLQALLPLQHSNLGDLLPFFGLLVQCSCQWGIFNHGHIIFFNHLTNLQRKVIHPLASQQVHLPLLFDGRWQPQSEWGLRPQHPAFGTS